MTILHMKKALVVAVLGALLFVASFVVSGRIQADGAFCGVTSGVVGLVAAPGGQPCGGGAVNNGGQLMVASYYGYAHAGAPTASGEIFDPTLYTAAHRTMPFGTRLQVSHGGATTQVVVNDRGPHIDGRDLDLSQAAAETIGLTGPGVAPVEVKVQ